MEKNMFVATGRRKTAVASVRMTPGKGVFTVNGRQILDYLTRETLVDHAIEPLLVAEMKSSLDIRCSTRGGGLTGQAGAIRLAVARALCLLNSELQPSMRKEGLLVRDARKVERKKYGQPKARKRFQYSKR